MNRGSTFKAVTSAMAIEEGMVTPSTKVRCWPINLFGHNISCWSDVPHGDETFTEAVYNSCNTVFVEIARKAGIKKFYSYMRNFGFYNKTGIDLPGEADSYMHKEPKEIDLAVASFGQRFQITPIQLITAYAAIANGGKLLKPKVVKEIVDADGNLVKKFDTKIVDTVISQKTSSTLCNILEGVVSEGTGTNAYVRGYKVAGKTGTSETTSKDRYIASFSAFAPADNPKICVLIVLDNPQGAYLRK